MINSKSHCVVSNGMFDYLSVDVMTEKVVGVVSLLVFTSFATPTYAGKIIAMELRLTTFNTAAHNSANCIRVICVQE